MPFIPGLLATPTVIANALLSLAKDSSLPVLGPDRVGVVSPMFNEEAGAAEALASLLRQSAPFDELVVSINGGSDATGEVVGRTLAEHGYRAVDRGPVPDATATFERWLLQGGPPVVVVDHAQPISKSDSINVALEGGLLNSERVLIVDGDTVFEEHFLAGLKANFYRLRRLGKGKNSRFVIDDYAIQSGAVMSAKPEPGKPMAGLIHRARSAEYAIAAVLRKGQTARIGEGAVFGRSRLYTVVGCGFTARREYFPIPSDTLTEDHDFTLTVQNGPSVDEEVTVRELTERGFRAIVGGEEVELEQLIGEYPVRMRHGSDARFITEALMFTEDPPSLPSYLRQLERWNGGGVENGLKRVFVRDAWSRLRPNVRFTVATAHFENLFGLALLLVLPLFLGLNFALPGHGTPLSALLIWLGIDLGVGALLTAWGFGRLGRGQGTRGWQLARVVVRNTARSVAALTVLRAFNAVTFVTGALRAISRFINRQEIDPRATITWERPRSNTAKRTQLRFFGATTGMLTLGVSIFVVTASLAADTRPGYRDTWRLIYESVPVPQTTHQQVRLPLGGSSLLAQVVDAGLDASSRMPDEAAASPDAQGGAVEAAAAADADLEPLALGLGLKVRAAIHGEHQVSAFCTAHDVRRPAQKRHTLEAPAADYEPLSNWGLLMLARLTPLVANIEEAATAYDVPADLLLRVLINESYLDPLAVGITGDLGLSQVTTDALTLIRALSTDSLSPFANPSLFAGTFSVFDPDFSVCAGAVKLAWARSQPGGNDDRFAYARYINPLEGVVRGKVSERHSELVVAIDDLKPLALALEATIGAYRADPTSVADKERALLGVTNLVADGRITVAQAYFVTAELVESFGIDDLPLYDAIRQKLYADPGAAPSPEVGSDQG